MRSLWLGASGFAATALAVGSAHADADVLRLSWTAPSECPSSGEVRAAALRGLDTTRMTELLEAEAIVERLEPAANGQPWRVRLRTRRGETSGEREIEASSCAGLADATAVLLGLALAPPDSAPVVAVPKVSVPAPAATAEAALPSSPSTSEGPTHWLAVGLSGAGAVAALPSLAVGGSLTIAWTPGSARVELDARSWGGQSAASAVSDAGARFSMTSLGGRACWAVLRTHRFDLSPCAGADGSFVSASGYGSDKNFTPNAAWTSLAGGGLARVRVASWLALRGRVEGTVPTSRPTFVVQNEGVVHRPSAVGAAASFGVEVLFL